MKVPSKGREELVHENPFSSVIRLKANFGSFTKHYYITHFGPRAGLVAVRGSRVLLVRQGDIDQDGEW